MRDANHPADATRADRSMTARRSGWRLRQCDISLGNGSRRGGVPFVDISWL